MPYIDGAPVAYTKAASGTGAGNFANGPLHFMSRAGAGLFGGGDLDEVAVYNVRPQREHDRRAPRRGRALSA